MTVGLQITDGTTILELNDGSYFEVMELDLGYGDVSAQTVTGSVRVYINGTKAQIQTEVAAVQKLLQQAMDYSGFGLGGGLYSALDEQVYLQYRTDSTETYYRSPIVRASIRIDPTSIEVLNFNCGGVEYIIDFERKNWWEGAETEVQLSTHLASAATGGQMVYNPTVMYSGSGISFTNATGIIADTANGLAKYKTGDTIIITGSTDNDGKYLVGTGGVAGQIVISTTPPSGGGYSTSLTDEPSGATVYIHGAAANYVDIAAAQISGDMPAATRIEMVTNYDSTVDGVASRYTKYVWVGQDFTGNASSFDHLYEGEDGSTGTNTENNISSGGYYNNVTIATGSGLGVETTVTTWLTTDASINARNGRYVKMFAAFKQDDTAFESMRFRAILLLNNVTFWQSSQVKLDTSFHTNIRDLFTFALPPTVAGLGNLSGFNVRLTAYQETGSNQDCALDWIMLLPVDGFTYIKTKSGVRVDELSRLVLDGFNGIAYLDRASTANTVSPQAVISGIPIMLQPGRINRLYFIQHTNEDNEWYCRQTMTVKVYYRPRRMTL